MGKVYEKLESFKTKYPRTFGFRLDKHAKVAEDSLAKGEIVQYVFCGSCGIFKTYVVTITDKRVIISHKHLTFGNYCKSISKDKICEMSINKGIAWSDVNISLLPEEYITLCFVDPKATSEIKEHYVKDIISKPATTRRETTTTRKVYNSKSKNLDRYRALDELYRRKYETAKTEEERIELRIKILENNIKYLEEAPLDEQVTNNPYQLSMRKRD